MTITMYALSAMILLLPNIAFWWVYRLDVQSRVWIVVVKGVVAGLAGWTWVFPAVYLLPSGSVKYAVFMGWFIGGHIVSVVGGVLFSMAMSLFLTYFAIRPGFILRALAGTAFGLIVGIVTAKVLDTPNENQNGQLLAFMIFHLTAAGLASGIINNPFRQTD